MSLIKKLPDARLGDQFADWVRHSESMPSIPHTRWLSNLLSARAPTSKICGSFRSVRKSDCAAGGGCTALRVVSAIESTALRNGVILDCES